VRNAVIGDPALILADEPTGALDSGTGLGILALFQALNRAGRTIAMVTHDEHVARHARRILRLQDGRIVADERIAAPCDARAAVEADAIIPMRPRQRMASA
jgi:putative ABC transport system ATP-binding protein